ncbi:proteinase inhibitor I4 serpin [Anabaena lutea]|uniref:Proteinase inhibitor I4 serpin n=1 Tax=Anabaena lutea FACHB-196 TaxID=2692881 RepID=A0ABR8FCN4_9NOST|nr:proteinase inhibitor I4 serpin [Anabaena lutea]MBD2567987.1 proteinase inhibitor I4 serpin [Anabaena lutea FACHB-196]
MTGQKFRDVQENFLQRRYGVSLGRRYVLAAASVVLLGVLGCSQVDSTNNLMTKSRLPSSESLLSNENNQQ